MKRSIGILVALSLIISAAGASWAQSTLEKIDKSGTLIIGTRTGSPPFAFVNKNNDWVGFSIDLVEQTILPGLSKKLNKPIKL